MSAPLKFDSSLTLIPVYFSSPYCCTFILILWATRPRCCRNVRPSRSRDPHRAASSMFPPQPRRPPHFLLLVFALPPPRHSSSANLAFLSLLTRLYGIDDALVLLLHSCRRLPLAKGSLLKVSRGRASSHFSSCLGALRARPRSRPRHEALPPPDPTDGASFPPASDWARVSWRLMLLQGVPHVFTASHARFCHSSVTATATALRATAQLGSHTSQDPHPGPGAGRARPCSVYRVGRAVFRSS